MKKILTFLAIILFLGFGLFAGMITSHGNNSKGGQKVTICHKGRSITVDEHALPAHLAHGDNIGSCGQDPNNSDPGATKPSAPSSGGDDEVSVSVGF